MNEPLPRIVKAAMVLAALQLPRLGALRFFAMASQGTLPAVFAVPAGTGDLLIALTAPVVVVALRKGGLSAWAWAIAWNAVGIVDLLFAVAIGGLTDFPLRHQMTVAPGLAAPLAIIPLLAVPLCILFHATSVTLLFRKQVRVYFMNREAGRQS